MTTIANMEGCPRIVQILSESGVSKLRLLKENHNMTKEEQYDMVSEYSDLFQNLIGDHQYTFGEICVFLCLTNNILRKEWIDLDFPESGEILDLVFSHFKIHSDVVSDRAIHIPQEDDEEFDEGLETYMLSGMVVIYDEEELNILREREEELEDTWDFHCEEIEIGENYFKGVFSN